ncbi:hypothetical protein P175DRAFT_0529574 [Aspergillus ochraceoroseus IBT 24754]|uniref:Invertebrate defensins family profile domain-containing protein n=1 Tax=Aspergillus ochraceoroseus IBT 24754 TaxID=1392256 RepID=A0A2T5M1U6_9EURO|nr:uncharacterized protein P175DRAFT_0529574 [Aspergillus ochraceoroseus IBT 24754]PTU22510.1 hypothetical protein P175DRAFT_0529574 [Aspergillus ochraceoroseus IBT 24754]
MALPMPIIDALAAVQGSCNVAGGSAAANLACNNNCFLQGGGWKGGYCDAGLICHCTF